VETKTNRHIPAKINQQEATKSVIVSRDHDRPMRTLMQEMNISVTNAVRVMVSEDLRYKLIL
jgi:hypothetical protein